MNYVLIAVIIVYCIVELFSTVMFIGIILTDEFYYNKNYIKSYLKFIHDELIYEDRFIFPLSKFRICRYTTFGMIFFMIAWIIIFSIPFVIAVIINFFLLRIAIFFKKLLFKDSRGKEDTHDIDH